MSKQNKRTDTSKTVETPPRSKEQSERSTPRLEKLIVHNRWLWVALMIGLGTVAFLLPDSGDVSAHHQSEKKSADATRAAAAALPLQIIDISKVSIPRQTGFAWNDVNNIPFGEKGVVVELGDVSNAAGLEVSLDNNDSHRIVFLREKQPVAEQRIQKHPLPSPGGLFVYATGIPPEAVAGGFDALLIQPLQGDGRYALGHVTLK